VISGYQQRLIHDSAWDQLRAIENGKISIIGVNTHTDSTQCGIASQKLDDSLVEGQLGNLSRLRKSRDEDSVKIALEVVRDACNTGDNIMEPTISALKSEATIGEINSVMRDCFGTWVSPSGV
jgi:methylmalonyl-CoA mutase N-terminal domain/subunit